MAAAMVMVVVAMVRQLHPQQLSMQTDLLRLHFKLKVSYDVGYY